MKKKTKNLLEIIEGICIILSVIFFIMFVERADAKKWLGGIIYFLITLIFTISFLYIQSRLNKKQNH